jgi:MFS family permease
MLESENNRRPWREAFAALHHRNYRLFFWGQLISLTGTWMQAVAQGWLVYNDLKGSPFTLGLIAFLGLVPVTLLTVPAGTLADRYDKRRILFWTQASSMVLALLLAGLAWSGLIVVWHVAVLSFLLGLANAFDIPTRQSFIVDLVGRDKLPNAIALNSTMFNIARILGPSMAGVLIGVVGVAGCFLLNGLSYLAVIAGYLAMRLPNHTPPATPTPVWQAMQAAINFVRSERVVRRILLLVGLFSLLVFPFATLMPVFARDYLHGNARTYGFLGTANGVGALIGALTLAFLGEHSNQRRLFYVGLLGFCTTIALFAVSRQLWWSLSLITVAGWCFIVALATANTAVQQRVPDSLRGGVMGIYTLSFLGLAPIGSLLIGTLARWTSAPTAVLTGTLICTACAIRFAQQPTTETT